MSEYPDFGSCGSPVRVIVQGSTCVKVLICVDVRGMLHSSNRQRPDALVKCTRQNIGWPNGRTDEWWALNCIQEPRWRLHRRRRLRWSQPRLNEEKGTTGDNSRAVLSLFPITVFCHGSGRGRVHRSRGLSGTASRCETCLMRISEYGPPRVRSVPGYPRWSPPRALPSAIRGMPSHSIQDSRCFFRTRCPPSSVTVSARSRGNRPRARPCLSWCSKRTTVGRSRPRRSRGFPCWFI